MEGYNKYAALANTIKIEDITSDAKNRSILQRLRDNDSEFTMLIITTNHFSEHETYDNYYLPVHGEDLGWLGYFIGQNTKLHELQFYQTIVNNESFYKEMSNNRSISKLVFCHDGYFNKLLPLLSPFFKNNLNLKEIDVEEDCDLVDEDARQLSLAIGNCNKSLRRIAITFCFVEHRNSRLVVDIITALSMHPQLKSVQLGGMNIGRNIEECSAISTLLHCTATQLQILDLDDNLIDDEGMEVLVLALLNGNRLQKLDLSNNEGITIKGWKRLSTLLDMPSSLGDLRVQSNSIEDDGALVFANALSRNRQLRRLDLNYCRITRAGWAPFSKLLCDTSSVNDTYLSNHTLQYVGEEHKADDIPGITLFYLNLNEHENKQKVAMRKILRSHSHFNMEPFFEWEFKVLPIMINWFEMAKAFTTDRYDSKSYRMRLSVIYDFIREFPMLYIEPITRKEMHYYGRRDASRGSNRR